MSLTKFNPLDFSAASRTLSTLAIIYITSRQHLVVEKWLPAMHMLAAFVFALGEKARRRIVSGASNEQKSQSALSRIGWNIVTGLLLGTQHTLEVWSFFKLPSSLAIMISLLAVPFNLGLLSFLPPSAAFAHSATTTRFSASVLLLLLGLGITSAGKQDHICILLALVAVVMGVLINRLSLTKRSDPSCLTPVMIAFFVALGYAVTLGGPLPGYKLYVVQPLEPGIASSVLFAAWLTISHGGRAAVTLAGAKVPTSQSLSARGALLFQSLPLLVAALATVGITLLTGKYIDHSGSVRGHAWLQFILLIAAIVFTLYMVPRSDDEAHGEEDGSYNLLPADENRKRSSSSPAVPISSSLIPILSIVCTAPALVFIAQQSGLLAYRPTFDMLANFAKPPPPLPGTVTLHHRPPPPAFEASPLLEPTIHSKPPPRPQLEIVFAYYAEPLEGLPVIINDITREVNWWNTKVTAYHKGLGDLHSPTNASAQAEQTEILLDFVSKTGVDEVVPLKNIGREGATYLRHIIHHWDDLAYQTIFLQGHVVFEDEFWERLKLINERVGFMRNVTNPPKQITNNVGTIYLRQGNLTDVNHPLASNFSILAGRQEITLPSNVTAGNDYQIVLFGDSGNWSEDFEIEDPYM